MTINPSEFGNTVDHTDYGWLTVPMPAIEAHSKWCDGEPPHGRYHRHRARTHVEYAAGDELHLSFKMAHAASEVWTETLDDAGGVADDWTSTWALASETPHHPDPESTFAVPNATDAEVSHRYVMAVIKFKEAVGNVGSPELNMIQIGWENDNAIAATDPDVEPADRTGAHQFDSYNSASAWHIARVLLGTINRMQYESVYMPSFVLADQR